VNVKELVDDVNRGEIVMVDNDWYWDYNEHTRKWERVFDGKNAELLNHVFRYHPEFEMDDDEEAAVTWVYLRKRN
jgi:hypothetical protein